MVGGADDADDGGESGAGDERAACEAAGVTAHEVVSVGGPRAGAATIAWTRPPTRVEKTAAPAGARVAAEDLFALVELVLGKTGAERVHLIAHSMGGLVWQRGFVDEGCRGWGLDSERHPRSRLPSGCPSPCCTRGGRP